MVRNRHRRLQAPAAQIRRLFHVLDAAGLFPAPAGELSVALLGAAAMGRLHDQFMGDPAPTDVITFDGDPDFGSAGEICVCADVAAAYSREHGTAFARELTLYLVHGYLHLCGCDDRTAVQCRRMRAAERRAMALVEATGTVPAFALS